MSVSISSVTQSCPILWTHGLQHARLPCPSPTPRAYSNACPFNHLIFCHPLLLLSPILHSIRVFSNESVLHTRWPKHWSFSFSNSPSNGYSGVISFRMGWLDLPAVQGTLKSLPNTTIKSIDSSVLRFLYSLTLTSIHYNWKNNSLDKMDLCWQSSVSAFEYAV